MGTIESTTFATDDRRWEALELRDDRADGAFVYAVRTTGVYCRPGCRSRRPNRQNVAFFDDADAAERAGYRACKRCRPRDDRPGPVRSKAVVLACRIIQDAERPPGLVELAGAVGLAPSYLQKVFQRAVGVTPKEYAMTLRAQKLREALPGAESVAGAIFGAGFGSIGRAYDGAMGELGMTPDEYRRGDPGQPIRFATTRCSMGWLIVAETDRGLCSIELGDSKEELEARLLGRFPTAERAEGVPDFEGRLGRVVAVVDRPEVGLDLPLDIRGTAFQRQVWEALRSIPAGSTATYAEVARSIDRPSAVRAVARACASNALAVVIPCHRVVRGDGGLGGYRWGIERKQALLDIEASASPDSVSPESLAD